MDIVGIIHADVVDQVMLDIFIRSNRILERAMQVANLDAIRPYTFFENGVVKTKMMTPLMHAIDVSSVECFQGLLEHGANPHLVLPESGHNLLRFAVTCSASDRLYFEKRSAPVSSYYKSFRICSIWLTLQVAWHLQLLPWRRMTCIFFDVVWRMVPIQT